MDFRFGDSNSIDSDSPYESCIDSGVLSDPGFIKVADSMISTSYPTQFVILGIVFDDPKQKEGRGREMYGGDNQGEYMICTWKNGMKNGDGLLYDRFGELLFRGTYIDDYLDGNGYIYENGLVIMKCRYYRNYMNSAVYVECSDEHIIMVEKSSNGFIKYRGGFNEEFMEREGFGAEYENGYLSHYGIYENNMVVQITKRFNNGIMIEYDDDEKVTYQGKFMDNISHGFPREGEGREFVDGILSFHGIYKDGVRDGPGVEYHEHGIAKMKGIWKNGELIEKHEVDDQGFLKGVRFDGRSEITIRIVNGVETVSMRVNHIVIANCSCNSDEMTKLVFDSARQLISINIGDGSFNNTRFVSICNLPNLVSVLIGKDCFTQYDRYTNKPFDNVNKELCLQERAKCIISRCRKLKIIKFGIGSFSSYCSLEIDNLPLLQELRFGDASQYQVGFELGSYCFYWAENFRLQQLPLLEVVEIGCWCFNNALAVVVDELPSLTTFFAGFNSFYGNVDGLKLSLTACFVSLPELSFLTFGEYSFYNCVSLTLSYFPLIKKPEQFSILHEAFHSLKSIRMDKQNSRLLQNRMKQFKQSDLVLEDF